MNSNSTAILDVLTNGVGAMIILAVLFVTKVGEQANPLTPLAGTQVGSNTCDFLVLEVTHAMQRRHATQLRVTSSPETVPVWTWMPQSDPVAKVFDRFPGGFVSVGDQSLGDFTVGLPLTQAVTNVELTTDISDGLPGWPEELQVRAYLMGSTLSQAATADPSDVRLRSMFDRPASPGTQSPWSVWTPLPAKMLHRYGAARFSLDIVQLHGGCA